MTAVILDQAPVSALDLGFRRQNEICILGQVGTAKKIIWAKDRSDGRYEVCLSRLMDACGKEQEGEIQRATRTTVPKTDYTAKGKRYS